MSSIIYDFHGFLMYLHLTKLQILICRNIVHKSALLLFIFILMLNVKLLSNYIHLQYEKLLG